MALKLSLLFIAAIITAVATITIELKEVIHQVLINADLGLSAEITNALTPLLQLTVAICKQ